MRLATAHTHLGPVVVLRAGARILRAVRPDLVIKLHTASGLARPAARAADRRAEERTAGGPVVGLWLLRQRLAVAGPRGGVRVGGAVPPGQCRGAGGGARRGGHAAAAAVEGAGGGGDQRAAGGGSGGGRPGGWGGGWGGGGGGGGPRLGGGAGAARGG